MPLVQLIGSPLTSSISSMVSVGTETEFSRLRDLKAKLDKLQHHIRELGGDPPTLAAADLPEQAAKSSNPQAPPGQPKPTESGQEGASRAGGERREEHAATVAQNIATPETGGAASPGNHAGQRIKAPPRGSPNGARGASPPCAPGNCQGSGVGVGKKQRPESLGQIDEGREEAGQGSGLQQPPTNNDEQHYHGHHCEGNGGKPIGNHGKTRARGQVIADPRTTTQSRDEMSMSPFGSCCQPPKGFIKTLEVNGIVASAEGGWKRCGAHPASHGPDEPRKGQSPDFETNQNNEYRDCEGEPHIRHVLLPNIMRLLFIGWVGWYQLYVEAKVKKKKARGRPHQSING